MDERAPEPISRAAAAAARAARRGQINALRTRVVVLAVSVFVAAWGVVFVRLVEGHDPGLASTAGAVVTQSADPEVPEDDAVTDADPAPVTTQS